MARTRRNYNPGLPVAHPHARPIQYARNVNCGTRTKAAEIAKHIGVLDALQGWPIGKANRLAKQANERRVHDDRSIACWAELDFIGGNWERC